MTEEERDEIVEAVRGYYEGRLVEHGPTARGVDWNSVESQHIRFHQLARVLDPDNSGSLLDFGCGYGAMLGYLLDVGWQGTYTGFDLSAAMVHAARTVHGSTAEFVVELSPDAEFDYVVASGVFNVRLGHDVTTWVQYVDDTLDEIDRRARRGWAVNMLTSYSDFERLRQDLYYDDPSERFRHCMTYSRNVALLHDYDLYEFTVLVRK